MRKFLKYVSVAVLMLLVVMSSACSSGVDTSTGAVVNLKIITSAENFTVSASYGEVKGEGKDYTVTLERKKDFVITVSAEGYMTESVFVSVTDLADGICNKEISLSKPGIKFVRIEVLGGKHNVSVVCDGVQFNKSDNVYSAELTVSQLRSGITVSADNAETYLFVPSDEIIDGSFINKKVYLASKGNILLEFVNYPSSVYFTDQNGKFIEKKYESEYGENSYNRIEIDKNYRGEIKLFGMNGEPELLLTTEIDSETTVYDNLFSNDNNKYLYIYGNDIPEFLTCDKLGLESEETLKVFYTSVNNDGRNDYIGFNATIESDLNIILFDTVNGYSYTMKYVEGKTKYNFSDFKREPFDFAQSFDRAFALMSEDLHFLLSGIKSVKYKTSSDGEVVVLPVKDGAFVTKERLPMITYMAFGDNEKFNLYSVDYNNKYVKADGKWCIPIEIYRVFTDYIIEIKDQDGNKVTGANVYSGENAFSEQSEGVYVFNSDSIIENITVEKEGIKRNCRVDFNCEERKVDAENFTVKIDLVLTEYVWAIIKLDRDINIIDIQTDDERVLLNSISNDDFNKNYYYVYTPWDAVFNLSVKFTDEDGNEENVIKDIDVNNLFKSWDIYISVYD